MEIVKHGLGEDGKCVSSDPWQLQYSQSHSVGMANYSGCGPAYQSPEGYGVWMFQSDITQNHKQFSSCLSQYLEA